MSSSDLRRVSVDHSRLQGWLTVANAIETGKGGNDVLSVAY